MNRLIWKVRREAHPEASTVSADTRVFVGSLGRTMQLTGQLRLTKEEADDMEKRLTSTSITEEEFDRLEQFLQEWAETDAEAMYLSLMVNRVFPSMVLVKPVEEEPGG